MYTDYRMKFIDTLESVFKVENEKARENYWDYEMGENEYISRDGFMSFIEGGFHVRKFTSIRHLDDGTSFKIEALDNKIRSCIAQGYSSAKKRFIENHPEYKEKEFDYHSLYEEGNGKFAEELSEYESDELSDMDLMLEFCIQYYDEGNRRSDLYEEDSLYIACVVNFDFDYHRQCNNEVLLFSETIPAKDCTARLKELAEKAKEIFDKVKD